jgi:hypothetical protein
MNMSARTIQSLWRNYIAAPPKKITLPDIVGRKGVACGIDRLIVVIESKIHDNTITQRARPLGFQPQTQTFEARGQTRPSPLLPLVLLTSLSDELYFLKHSKN